MKITAKELLSGVRPEIMAVRRSSDCLRSVVISVPYANIRCIDSKVTKHTPYEAGLGRVLFPTNIPMPNWGESDTYHWAEIQDIEGVPTIVAIEGNGDASEFILASETKSHEEWLKKNPPTYRGLLSTAGTREVGDFRDRYEGR